MRKTMTACAVLVAVLAGRDVGAQSHERGWIDVNFGVAVAAEEEFTMSGTGVWFAEPADFAADYQLPRGASFDFGGGYMITPLIGVGVSFTGTAHEEVAGLRVRIPHPLYANAYGSDSATTEGRLRRIEGGVNIQAMLVPVQTERFRFRVFGGPTYFRVEQDAVSDIRFDQVYGIFNRANAVEITEYDTRTVEGTGWGFHAGADASIFFTRVVGIGGFARFSRGSVDLEDTLASAVGDDDVVGVKAGGFQVGGGLRLKF
ncbi:MAG TPA: hypothetical protein VIL35_16895 [Vicinamibacterales bacterium]